MFRDEATVVIDCFDHELQIGILGDHERLEIESNNEL